MTEITDIEVRPGKKVPLREGTDRSIVKGGVTRATSTRQPPCPPPPPPPKKKGEVMRKIICHADGDRCLGCAHYRGDSPLCEFVGEQDELATLRAENERLEAEKKDALDLARFLARYLEQLNELRGRLMNPKPGESASELAVMQWPVIQTTRGQMRFLRLGKQPYDVVGVGRALDAALTEKPR